MSKKVFLIEIEDIERKGNVVYVHCAIKSIIKP